MIGGTVDSGLTGIEIGIILSVLVMTMLLFFVVYFATDARTRRRDRRITELRERTLSATGSGELESSASAVRRENDSSLDSMVKRFLPKPDLLRLRLKRTGRNITIGKFGVYILITGLFLGFLAWRIFGFSPAVSLLIMFGAGLWLPHTYIGILINRRQNAFSANFPEGLDVVVRGLRAGLPIAESVVNASSEVSEPVKTVYSDISDAVNLGQSLEDAIADAAKVMNTAELKFFAICLSVQRETGGNLAETLMNLAEILRKRRQMKLKIKAMSSEARASAYILGSLPFIMFGLLYLVNQDYVMVLFNDPRGLFLVGLGATSMGTGVGIMWKMVNFEI
jgi:tight adherence protein B